VGGVQKSSNDRLAEDGRGGRGLYDSYGTLVTLCKLVYEWYDFEVAENKFCVCCGFAPKRKSERKKQKKKCSFFYCTTGF